MNLFAKRCREGMFGYVILPLASAWERCCNRPLANYQFSIAASSQNKSAENVNVETLEVTSVKFVVSRYA